MMRQKHIIAVWILMLSVSIGAHGLSFDTERAYNHMKNICNFGPRVPGTAAHKKCLNYIRSTMQENWYKVYLQEFEDEPRLLGKRVKMTNIIAYSDPPSTGTVILISSHWDTRPIAEKGEPFPVWRQGKAPGNIYGQFLQVKELPGCAISDGNS